MKNGNYDGPAKMYFENGTLMQEGFFDSGKISGRWIRYFENGDKYVISNWKNGFRNGETIDFYENGQIKSEVDYVMGKAWGSNS